MTTDTVLAWGFVMLMVAVLLFLVVWMAILLARRGDSEGSIPQCLRPTPPWYDPEGPSAAFFENTGGRIPPGTAIHGTYGVDWGGDLNYYEQANPNPGAAEGQGAQ